MDHGHDQNCVTSSNTYLFHFVRIITTTSESQNMLLVEPTSRLATYVAVESTDIEKQICHLKTQSLLIDYSDDNDSVSRTVHESLEQDFSRE